MNTTHNEIQIEMKMRLRHQREGALTDEAVEEFCQLLRGRGWVTARRIQMLRPEWDDRYIRRLASASKTRVMSFPGSPGYRLTKELTADDAEQLDHAANALISQGRENIERGLSYQRLAALLRATAKMLSGADILSAPCRADILSAGGMGEGGGMARSTAETGRQIVGPTLEAR
jgi:hypothetical protein